MNEEKFYDFLQKQILLLVGWSIITGFGFTILCFIYDVMQPAIIWYGVVVAVSLWGWYLNRQFDYSNADINALENWYLKVKLFIYVTFGLWTVLFILYSGVLQNNINMVTVFTQIGASVIAATFLFSDKKLFVPILLIMMYPLIIYFLSAQEAYGYFSAVYAIVFLGMLLYSSNNSNQLIQKIYYQAQHDALTGLHNRRYFNDYLDQMLLSFKNSHKFAYLLLIDLDYFKTINDSLGHDIGDSLLKEVSDRITKYCEKSHLIARIGGDEFMIVSYEFDEAKACQKEAEAFAKVLGGILKETYVIDYNHLHISASIGIKIIDRTVLKTSQLIKDVDIAMYEAKAGGRDGAVHFDKALALQVDNTLEIERKLYFALKNNEIELYYQAQVDEQENVIGCEVLSRWYNEELGLISPMQFIGIAEKTGLIIDLGNYILEESFKTLQKWHDKGIDFKQFSINISVRQLMHTSFFNHVTHLCNRYLTEETRKKIIFEITETLLAEDIEKVVSNILQFKKMDIRFSMDDFGTGYSSLSYLRELPIDELKIDRAFVKHLGESNSDEMMIKTIFSLADIFGLSVVAEGVETGEQFRLLLAYGCHIFQGYYFSKPMLQEDFEIYLFRSKIKKVNRKLKIKKEINRKMII